MAENSHRILKTLDNPVRILFWDLFEFLAMALPFLIGMALGSFLIMLMGIPVKILYSKLTKKLSHNSISHFIYWYLPRSAKHKNLPPSHLREFIL